MATDRSETNCYPAAPGSALLAVRHKVLKVKLVLDMMNENPEKLARATHPRKDSHTLTFISWS